MKMRKILAVLVAAVMVLAMLPVMAVTTSAADVDGDWDTFRNGEEYTPAHEEEGYKPAPGYRYTDEGFSTVPADYTNTSPYFNVMTKEKQSLKDGFYVEMRVDEYSYTGDHWIGFSVWSSQELAPGNTNYGSGWLGMARVPGNGGSGQLDNAITMKKSDDAAGYFNYLTGTTITPKVDGEGREIYTMEITHDGSRYNISICGVTVPNSDSITTLLNELDANGDFYVGLTMYSGEKNGKAGLTILKYGTSEDDAETPIGSDRKDPEPNINVIAEIADPSTVEENQPALIYDANLYNAPSGANFEASALGDNAFRIEATASAIYFNWNVKKSLSYDAKDFPVVAIMLRSYDSTGGTCYYSAGDVMSADPNHMISWGLWDSGALELETDDGFYNMTLIDLTDMWEGRVNAVRFDFAEIDVTDEDYASFDICWAGVFRSVEEAQAYTRAWATEKGIADAEIVETEEPETEEATDDELETPLAQTEAPTETPATNGESNGTDAETKVEEKKGGCGSVIGSVAVLMTAAAAAVALKKKD